METGHKIFSSKELMRAWNNDEFEFWCQPVVRAADRSVVGTELLVRWYLPDGRIVSSNKFIDQIDNSGLLSALTRKMMWRASLLLGGVSCYLPPSFYLVIKIKTELLLDKHFTNDCLMLIRKKRIQLVLALTEKEPFIVGDQMIAILDSLSNAGIKFVLDDFGSGYSLLSYFKYFPVSYIKTDSSFTLDILREPSSRHIIENVVRLAELLNVQVIADGVETRGQFCCLKNLGVDYMQGSYWGNPEPLIFFVQDIKSGYKVFTGW